MRGPLPKERAAFSAGGKERTFEKAGSSWIMSAISSLETDSEMLKSWGCGVCCEMGNLLGLSDLNWRQRWVEHRKGLSNYFDWSIPIILIDHNVLGTILITSHLIFIAILQGVVLPYKYVNRSTERLNYLSETTIVCIWTISRSDSKSILFPCTNLLYWPWVTG